MYDCLLKSHTKDIFSPPFKGITSHVHAIKICFSSKRNEHEKFVHCSENVSTQQFACTNFQKIAPLQKKRVPSFSIGRQYVRPRHKKKNSNLSFQAFEKSLSYTCEVNREFIYLFCFRTSF